MSAILSALVDDFRRLSIVVIGEAMLDTYLEGSTGRLCSEAPVPIVSLARRIEAPGGAANTASNARNLGARVTLLSVIGADPAGRCLRDALTVSGLDPRHLLASHRRTTLTKQRVIADGQMLVRFDDGSTEPIDRATENLLIERLIRAHAAADAIVVSDYGYGILTPRVIDHLAELQSREPRVLLVDSKNLPAFRAAGVTAIKPNYDQAARLVGVAAAAGPEGRARAIADRRAELLELTGALLAAVTLDSDGAIVLDQQGTAYRAYARPLRQARAAGAGDTFGVAFALALAAAADVPAATDLAMAAAGVVVAKDGTAVCSADELRRTLTVEPKVLADGNALAACVEWHRQQGRRIVFTNGCFDILHRGHIAYLNRAKALGDVLLVGVNSDASVRRLKGPDRPINPATDRVEVLAALSCVDHIVTFDEDTPENLIRVIRPHTFVKGGNYRRDQLPEAGLVETLGGVVELLPYVEDRSTTGIIARIRQHAGAEVAA